MTRNQENAIETLALEYGGVCVEEMRDGSGVVFVTEPRGQRFRVTDTGVRKAGVDFSVDWGTEA